MSTIQRCLDHDAIHSQDNLPGILRAFSHLSTPIPVYYGIR